MFEVEWGVFKDIINARSLSIQYAETSDTYYIWATAAQTRILKDGGAAQIEFEASYKPTANLNPWASGNITTLIDTIDFDCSDVSTIAIQIAGTWSGVIGFYVSTDGVNFNEAGNVINIFSGGDFTSSTSANGQWRATVAGLKTFRISTALLSWTSGTANVYVGSSTSSTLIDNIVGTLAVSGDLRIHASDGSDINLGQSNMAGSLPVVLASNQSSIPVAATLQAGAASIGILGANSGVDIGDVTINNAGGAAAVNIQDGGNSITVDGTISAAQSGTWTVQPGNTANTTAWKVDASSVAIPVTDNGSSLTVDNNGTFPVQASLSASLPAGTNGIGKLTANSGVIIGDVNVVNSNVSTNIAQMNGVATTMGNGGSGTGVQRVTIASDSTGQVALATGSNTIGALTANQSINNAQIAGVATATGNGGVSTGVQRVAIASDNTAFAVNATGPTLTKGTQGATGFSTQDLKDAGRTAIMFSATGVASGTTTTETAITMVKSAGTAATSSAASFVITNGKTFRITAITFASRGNTTATAQVTTFNLRLNTAGAVVTTSTPILMSIRSATPATSFAWDRVFVTIPDGYEIAGNGTIQFGVTANAVFTTNAPTWDVNIIGYEY